MDLKPHHRREYAASAKAWRSLDFVNSLYRSRLLRTSQ
jgi:hypothetical protein